LSNERTFSVDLTSIPQCEARIPDLFEELVGDLKKSGGEDRVKAVFVKIRFADFTRTTVERAGLPLAMESFLTLLREGLGRKALGVRLLGLGVRFKDENSSNPSQMELW
jgi:DNA polymerase-4